MIDLLGREILIVQAKDPSMVGVRGTVALESMKMLTIVSGETKRSVPKHGTVVQLQDSGNLVVASDAVGRIEERLARGSKV